MHVMLYHVMKHPDNFLKTVFNLDVDECKMSTHKCSQVCANTLGGYNCLCFFGFDLKEDRVNCEEGKHFLAITFHLIIADL